MKHQLPQDEDELTLLRDFTAAALRFAAVSLGILCFYLLMSAVMYD